MCWCGILAQLGRRGDGVRGCVVWPSTPCSEVQAWEATVSSSAVPPQESFLFGKQAGA